MLGCASQPLVGPNRISYAYLRVQSRSWVGCGVEDGVWQDGRGKR